MRCRVTVVCVALTGVCAALGICGISASFARIPVRTLRVRVSQPTLRGASSGQHLIRVDARTQPSSVCEAVVHVRRVREALTKVRTDTRGRVAWRWLILPSSPSGTWRITVVCQHGHLRGSGTTSILVVTASKHSKGPIGDPHSLENPHGTVAGQGGGVCGPFEPGQCTCLAYQKRPDVYNTGVAHGIPAGGTRAAGTAFYVWDGEQWLVNAQRAGIPTGSEPVAGALIVWGIPNSAAYGHVAYVEQASSPTHVLVNECNYDFHGHCRTIWENPQAAANLQGYIYGGPAGNGPGSGGPGPAPGPGGGPPEPPSAAYGSMPAIAVGPSGLPTVVAQSPSNSLDAYWETPDAQWHGPLGIGTGGSTYSAPSIGASAAGYPVVAAEGPSNSLYVYWETSDAQWHGPLGIGAAGSTYSAPSVGVGSSGLPTVVVQGPSNSLYAYWETGDAQWHGPLGIGAGGSTYSAPSVTSASTVVVQGPSNSLDAYWETPDAQWHGPLGIGPAGSTYSAPSAATSGSGLPTVAVQGPSNSLYAYWETSDAQWHGPLGIGPGGSTLSAPSVAVGSSGLPTVGAAGPSNSLDLYWETGDAQWHGPLGVGAGGSTFSAPSLAASPSGLPVIATQGPSNSLYAYWETPDAQWHGPLGVGAGGSTF